MKLSTVMFATLLGLVTAHPSEMVPRDVRLWSGVDAGGDKMPCTIADRAIQGEYASFVCWPNVKKANQCKEGRMLQPFEFDVECPVSNT